MKQTSIRLFNEHSLRNFLQTRGTNAAAEIKSMNLDEFASIDKETLITNLELKYHLTPPTVFFEQTTNAVEPPLNGNAVFKFSIPFSGDTELFRYQPSTYYRHTEIVVVEQNRLLYSPSLKLFSIDQIEIQAHIRRNFDEFSGFLRDSLESVKKDVEAFHRELRNKLETEYQRLKNRWQLYQATQAALPFPLEERQEKPALYDFPRQPSSVKITSQQHSKGETTQWILADEDYKHIIDVISSMARVMELAPNAFYHLKEEQLRWFFVLLLNAHFKGDVTGETFIRGGKGDVVIIAKDNGAVFVAECKVQEEKSGNKRIVEAIDQILANLTWRETKAAILIFDRTKSPTALGERIQNVAQEHPAFFRMLPNTEQGHIVAVFAHPDDKGQKAKVTMLKFSVPVSLDRFEKGRNKP